MLLEYAKVRQVTGQPKRRWFVDREGDLDLIVWFDDDEKPIGFQLCYDKGNGEHAAGWCRDMGFSHRRVDDGESFASMRKMTPVLEPDGFFPAEIVLQHFLAAAEAIEPAIREFVVDRLSS